MASGDNVDVIEVVETSFSGPAPPAQDRRPEQSTEEDYKSSGEKTTAFDTSVVQHGITGGKAPVGVSRNKSERERKIGHRRVGVGGEITYKKIQTTQIMGSIQLGIQHAVGGLASKPERDLLMQDFMTVETTNFPSEGSNHTPAHHFSEFKFKNYAPIAFRYFRDLFGIQPDDFLMSMCSAPLRELSNPGASGSIFYLTEDDEFIIKTVQHKEGEFLQTLLPGYYMNLNQNPRTLLPKFFGLYCYRCNSKNVRLVAMNNLLPSSVKLHQKYDLKGSTYKRKASKSERSKSSPTYKDLDFIEHHPEGIFLEADTYGALVKTIQRDCRVLESFKIMDYSLLVGIHNLDQAAKEKTQEQRLSASADEEGETGAESGGFIHVEREKEREDRIGAAALNRSRSINRQRLVAHSTAMESIQAESEPIDEEDDVPSGGIPARNARGERLLLFLGIIDILQSYRLKKKLEHTWKSMIHDGDTVSVHRPGFYAQRFQDFMAKTVFKKIPSPLKHSPSKRKSITKPLRPLDGDFDSTVSPPDPAINAATNMAISSGSVPIATSTPVNLAAGPLSPPPLTLATGQVPHRDELPPGIAAAPTVKVTSYPAVLKGRSAASPPNPNLVPSGKVPPPVPPRGVASSRTARSGEEHRAAGAASTTSSVTSSRGDEAAIITRYRLHECSSSNPHHHHHHHHHHHQHLLPLTVDRSTRVSTSTTANDMTSTVTAATSNKATIATTTTTITTTTTTTTATTTTTTTISSALHALRHHRASTPNTHHVTTSHRDVSRRDRGSARPRRPVRNWRDRQELYEDDEFVGVEMVEDVYLVKTSRYPFRPDRGVYRSDRVSKARPREAEESGARDDVLEKHREGSNAGTDRLAKFTYFLNPSCRADLMNYRMSRKDKKHSETYYERMKRKQRELEASITTITTLSYREKSTSGVTNPKDEPGEEQVRRRTSKFAMRKRNSVLLRRIREKSWRKKRMAPRPSTKKRSSTALGSGSLQEESETKQEGSSRFPLEISSRGGNRFSSIELSLSSGQDRSIRNNNRVDEKEENVFEDANDERGGFKGIFAKNCEGNSEEGKIVRQSVSKFDRRTEEKLETLYNKSEETEKDSLKMMNFKRPTSRGAVLSASFDDVRSDNGDARTFVSEKVKSFESYRTNLRDEAKESRREDTYSFGCDVERKFALSSNETRSIVGEITRGGSKVGTSNSDPDQEKRAFKSLSSGHCNDLPTGPREFGSLVPNVSFLHTYRKSRSYT